MIQEIFLVSIKLFREQLKDFINQILRILNIPEDINSYKQMESSMKSIFQEYFNNIFESEANSDIFFSRIVKKYENFVYNQLIDFNKNEEFEDMIKSKSFREMISVIKKILLFIEFHDPPLKLKVFDFKERKIEMRVFRNSECICVEGFIKSEKNCLILLNPPLLKNGFVYQGLKPFVIVYEQNIAEKIEEVKEIVAELYENPKSQEKLVNISSISNNSFSNNTNINSIDKKLNSLNSSQKMFKNMNKNKAGRELNISEVKMNNLNEKIPKIQNKENPLNIRERMKVTLKDVEQNSEFDFKDENFIKNKIQIVKSNYENLEFNKGIKNQNNLPDPLQNNLKIIPQNEESKFSFNYRSTSHHNLFNQTNPGDRNNKRQINFNGIINDENNAPLIEQLKGINRENIIQTSRSHFQSNKGEFASLDENTNTHKISESDYEFCDKLGTDINFTNERFTSKINKSSKSNSFTLKDHDQESISNASEIEMNYHHSNHKKPNPTTPLLNSDKKIHNPSFLDPYQTSDRGKYDENTLTKTIQKHGRKVNPLFFRSGLNKNQMRSLSKTPKQNQPRVVGYSPRTNIHYIFNEKQALTNNLIIKVENPNRKNQRYFGEDKKNSKNSSLSKEKKSLIIGGYCGLYQNKTLENKDENLKTQTNEHTLNIYKYRESTKNKLRQSQPFNTLNSKIGGPQNLLLVANNKTKMSNASYSKAKEENIHSKKKMIQKEKDINTVNSNQYQQRNKVNKSIDRKILTNAQTKLSMDDLLSFKKPEKTEKKEKKEKPEKVSPSYKDKASINYEAKLTHKTNFLNIKYV